MPPETVHQRVDVDTARQHVSFTLSRAFRGDVRQPESATFKVAATVTEAKPYEVYDIEGLLLFYLFPARVHGQQLRSWALAAADKVVGPSILSIDTPRIPWDPAESLRRASELAREEFGTGIGEARLVCYSYPRIGVQVQAGDGGSIIYDAVSFTKVPLREPGSRMFGAWSYYRTVLEPSAEERILIWERDQETVASTLLELDVPGLTAELSDQPDPGAPGVTSGLLQYSPHCRSHECFALYAQQNDIFCTAASAQMILDFYRYSYSQDAIAVVLKAGDGLPLPEPPAEKTAYESLSLGCLAAEIDDAPSWQKAMDEIDANRPVRDGIDGHVRVCTGWLEERDSSTGNLLRQWLRIHDPLPANADMCAGGTLTWERWEAIPRENFIYVRHRTTPCGQGGG